jgi:5'-AMP-activated protein kinase catalytic alpha subunit
MENKLQTNKNSSILNKNDSNIYINEKIGPFRITNKILGEGSTGTVRLAIHDETQMKYAVKIVKKRYSIRNSLNHQEALREIKILQTLCHENIIKIEYIEENDECIFIFSKYLSQGDLYNYIQKNGLFDEPTALFLFKQMVAALEFCHQQGICHHDFKLENCVIDENFHLRLIDFGYAIEFRNSDSNSSSPAGNNLLIRKYNCSPAYSSPEILFRIPHDASVDIFSLGTCLYYMVCGYFPFCDEERTTLEQLCHNLKVLRLEFPEYLSADIKDLMTKLIAKRENRARWDEIKGHPWFIQG